MPLNIGITLTETPPILCREPIADYTKVGHYLNFI